MVNASSLSLPDASLLIIHRATDGKVWLGIHSDIVMNCEDQKKDCQQPFSFLSLLTHCLYSCGHMTTILDPASIRPA